ncbi:MAG: Ferredoxin, partial [uncultured Gemmatimonadaceae bacterium]
GALTRAGQPDGRRAGAGARRDAGVHRGVPELPRRVHDDGAALPGEGGRARRRERGGGAARLRRALPGERQLHAARLALPRRDLRRLRRALSRLRGGVPHGERRRADGPLRRRVRELRRRVRADGGDGTGRGRRRGV